MITAREVARWRLLNQHLTAPHAHSASAVIHRLLAVQAENLGQSAWAVACRTAAADAAELPGLLAAGDVVRTHVLRPTWHYVAAVDVGWLLELTAPRVRPVFMRQLTDHGWSDAELDRAMGLIVDALAARPDQSREALGQHLGEGGLSVDGHQLGLLLGYAELERLVCSGRPLDGVHTYAPYADRVKGARRLDRTEALAELAVRYFTGHGPATERDLAYWATLTLGDVRKGLHESRASLATFEVDGRAYWHGVDSTPPSGAAEPAGHLLQILDETYRGYQESRMVIDADGIVPGGRETAIGMALVDGQIVAGMKRTLNRRVRFDLAPYRRLRADELDALEAAAIRYGRFLGVDHELTVAPA